MAQPAIERAPSIPWNSNPLFFIRNLIENDPKLSPRGRSHAILKLEDLKAMCTNDPRQQIIVAGAMDSYVTWVRLTEENSQAKRGAPNAEARGMQAARALNNCAKWLRLAGLGAVTRKVKRGKVFAAPRVKTDADQRRLDHGKHAGTPLAADPEDVDTP